MSELICVFLVLILFRFRVLVCTCDKPCNAERFRLAPSDAYVVHFGGSLQIHSFAQQQQPEDSNSSFVRVVSRACQVTDMLPMSLFVPAS